MMAGFSEQARYWIGLSACTLGSVGFAFWLILNRPLQNVHYTVIGFYSGVCDTIITGVGILIWLMTQSKENWPFDFTTNLMYFEVSIAALCSFAGQLLFIRCSQSENPALVSLLSYSHVIYCFIVDKVVFQAKFSLVQVVGLFVVLSFNLGTILAEFKT